MSEKFMCPFCNMKSNKIEYINQHIQTFHPQTSQMENQSCKKLKDDHKEEYSILCPRSDCGIEVTLTEYEDHLLAHSLQEDDTQTFSMKPDEGYYKQGVRYLEKMVDTNRMPVGEFYMQKAQLLECIKTGFDDKKTRTCGIIEHLLNFYPKNCDKEAIFSLPVDHYSSNFPDLGWGCGYRNIQMLLSCLMGCNQYKKVLFSDIPSITELQLHIETAWKEGFDAEGASQLGNRLRNTKKWIGATEVASLFLSKRIRCRLVDFSKAAYDGTHPKLFQWIFDYFKGSKTSNSQSSSSLSLALPPLYLQHDGHSRLIVGIEQDNRSKLKSIFIFDPSVKSSKMKEIRYAEAHDILQRTSILRFPLSKLKAKQYQLAFIDGLVNDNEYHNSKIIKSMLET